MLTDPGSGLHTAFTDLLQWIELHPRGAYLLVFLTAFLESLAVIGLFMPGAVLMFVIGALVATEALAFWPTYLWAAAGAIAGDGFSYWLGRHYHQQLRVLWPFRRYPMLLNHGVDFFHRHGGKSVLFARFVGPARAFLPAVAGMLDMPAPRFFAVNIFSAALWAPAYLLPGIVFGASLSLAAEVAGRLVVLILLTLGLLWFGVWLIRRLFNLLQPRINHWIEAAVNWSRGHPGIRPLAGALLEPDHPEARGLAAWLVLLFVSLAILGLLLGQPIIGIDQWVNAGMQSLRIPATDRVFLAVTLLGDSLLVFAVAVTVCLWLAWRGHLKAAAHWLVALVSAYALAQGLKALVGIERPVEIYTGVAQYAFPSVHATLNAAFFGFLAVIVARELPPVRRWIPYTLATVPILLIGLSRLYLGVHWLSDVVGGLALGLAVVTLFGIAYRRHPATPVAWRPLALFTLLLYAGGGALYIGQQFTPAMERYTQATTPVPLSTAQWLQGAWQSLPAYRQDLIGIQPHPLNVQYLGETRRLRRHLNEQGWYAPPAAKPSNFLLWLSPGTPAAQLPVMPQVHDGHYERLRLVKPAAGGGFWCLRLWQSDWRGGQAPLGVGNVTVLARQQQLGYLTYLKTRVDPDALTVLEADIGAGFEYVLRSRAADEGGKDQRVMLIREER